MNQLNQIQEIWIKDPDLYFTDIQRFNKKLCKLNLSYYGTMDPFYHFIFPESMLEFIQSLFYKYKEDIKITYPHYENKLNKIPPTHPSFSKNKEDIKITDPHKNEISKVTSTSRYIKESTKKMIAGKQKYKCKNSPQSQVIQEYDCPLWTCGDGNFDESGYEIDHIIEYSISKNHHIENLQALCKFCHSVKTKRFMMRFHE